MLESNMYTYVEIDETIIKKNVSIDGRLFDTKMGCLLRSFYGTSLLTQAYTIRNLNENFIRSAGYWKWSPKQSHGHCAHIKKESRS